MEYSQPTPSPLTPTEQLPSSPRPGYTLPVFACAAAIAALRWLNESPPKLNTVAVDLVNPAQTVDIPIEQVARLSDTSALAITRSDPGDNLDLTRHTPVWAWVQVQPVPDQSFTQSPIQNQIESIQIEGGEGIGRLIEQGGQAAIYWYARQLLHTNLERWRAPDQVVRVTFILPEGRSLAGRTSNAAFGVVEGLSLLGTSGISQPLSAPGQLEQYLQILRDRSQQRDRLVFCVGENGVALAQRLGIPAEAVIKTANWLGPMLAEAGNLGLSSVLLFGYHGKLMKLAGGIFHTHHHVADGRQEILAAACVHAGLSLAEIQALLNHSSSTAEQALTYLRDLETRTQQVWVESVYSYLVEAIDRRSQSYIHSHTQQQVSVGSVVFDRQREIIATSKTGATLLSQVC